MGWLFGSKDAAIDIDPKDKDFVENTLCWLAENLGGDAPALRGQLLPELKDFPFDNLADEEQLLRFAEKVSGYVGVAFEKVQVNLFDEQKKQYRRLIKNEERTEEIFIDERRIPYPALLTAVTATELLRLRLDSFFDDEQSLEDYSEMAATYYGFGLFVTECYNFESGRPAIPCFLSTDIHLYTMALLHHVAQKDVNYLEGYLEKELFTTLSRYVRALKAGAGTEFSQRWNQALEKHPLHKTAFDKLSSVEDKVTAYSRLLEVDPGNISYYNNRGYSYLFLREYEKAIPDFDKAIEGDPFWSYPFNNRGFAYLGLGQLEKGRTDIETALRLGGDEGYARRNLGYYFFLKNDFRSALANYEKAAAAQEGIDYIHYFTGLAWLKLGETAKARTEFERSKAVPEWPVPEYPEVV